MGILTIHYGVDQEFNIKLCGSEDNLLDFYDEELEIAMAGCKIKE
jgi:hypothetical protein